MQRTHRKVSGTRISCTQDCLLRHKRFKWERILVGIKCTVMVFAQDEWLVRCCVSLAFQVRFPELFLS